MKETETIITVGYAIDPRSIEQSYPSDKKNQFLVNKPWRYNTKHESTKLRKLYTDLFYNQLLILV